MESDSDTCGKGINPKVLLVRAEARRKEEKEEEGVAGSPSKSGETFLRELKACRKVLVALLRLRRSGVHLARAAERGGECRMLALCMVGWRNDVRGKPEARTRIKQKADTAPSPADCIKEIGRSRRSGPSLRVELYLRLSSNSAPSASVATRHSLSPRDLVTLSSILKLYLINSAAEEASSSDIRVIILISWSRSIIS